MSRQRRLKRKEACKNVIFAQPTSEEFCEIHGEKKNENDNIFKKVKHSFRKCESLLALVFLKLRFVEVCSIPTCITQFLKPTRGKKQNIY